VGLWNGRHAKKYYGNDSYNNLKVMKKKLDPNNIMNPVKVFGGRVTIGRVSMLSGFLIGFVGVLVVGWVGPRFLGLISLIQLLETSLLPSFYFPPLALIAFAAGLGGLLITRLMTLNQALAMGIPVLKILGKLLRR